MLAWLGLHVFMAAAMRRESMLPRFLQRTAPRIHLLATRRASTQMSREAFGEFLQGFMTMSRESSKAYIEQAMKGSGTRAYEAAMHAYRPSRQQVEKMMRSYGQGIEGQKMTERMLGAYGKGLQGRMLTQRMLNSHGFGPPGGLQQSIMDGMQARSAADQLLQNIKARVPMLEAGIPVKKVWQTPIPANLKEAVKLGVEQAYKAGKYGEGAEAKKLLAESLEFIAQGAGLLELSSGEALPDDSLQEAVADAVTEAVGSSMEQDAEVVAFLKDLHEAVQQLTSEEMEANMETFNEILFYATEMPPEVVPLETEDLSKMEDVE